MNPWRNGSIVRNPYQRTAFRVARLPVDIVRHRTVVQLISQTKRLLSAGSKVHVLNGATVSEADLNQAEKILLDPRERIAEELLEHPVEKSPLEELRRLAAAWEQEMDEGGEALENMDVSLIRPFGNEPRP